MKTLWCSVCLSFSMFSVFPSPQVEWSRENSRYMLCALPLVGLVIGAAMVGLDRLCRLLELEALLRGALLTALPAILSGGIHLDGFCDTADALASHAEPERKREIMKDSHAGAFAIIALGVYFLLYLASCGSIQNGMLFLLVPALSRSVGAFGGTVLRASGGRGLLAAFRDGASGVTGRVLFVWILLCLGGLALIDPLCAAGAALAALLGFFGTKRVAERQFGGMSGDLAGYMNVMTELSALLLCALAEKIGGLL